jgi:CRISPR system Cascade subunit CasE
MYLTRCQINPVARGAKKLLGSPQAMHAAVLAGFHLGSGDPGRVLWRVDVDGHSTMLYLLSAAKPDLTHLIDQAGWPTTQTWDTRSYQEVLDSVAAGQRWTFRLRANPIRSVPSQSGERGRLVAQRTLAEKTKWLIHRSEAIGADLGGLDQPDFTVTSHGVDRFQRRTGGRARRVTIAWARYDGTLTVTDADQLRTALTTGLGRAKGYGCGLLTLAPAE